MIVVVMLCAVVFYAVLYLAWDMSQTRLSGVDAWMRAIDHMIWMPDNLVFIIFRGLIIACMFYVIADWMVASTKRVKRSTTERREKKRQKNAKSQLGWKKPPTIE